MPKPYSSRPQSGDVRAITELANRIEGKPVQAVAAEVGGLEGLAEAIAEGRKRVAQMETRAKSSEPNGA